MSKKVFAGVHKPCFRLAGCDIFTLPNNEKVVEFLKQYIAQYGFRSGDTFMSVFLRVLQKKIGVEHITCPFRDHRERKNGTAH